MTIYVYNLIKVLYQFFCKYYYLISLMALKIRLVWILSTIHLKINGLDSRHSVTLRWETQMIRTKSNTIFPGNSPKISKATKNGNAPFTDLACLGKYEAQFPGQNSIFETNMMVEIHQKQPKDVF